MKPKTMILMAVAIVCGLAASYLASILLANQQKTIKVLQAKEKLTRWTPIRNPQDKFTEVEIFEKDKPNNAVMSEKWQEVAGRMLIKNLEPGATLTFDDLQSKDKGGLETELKDGHVAVAVRISAETGVGGFVLPGSHVNVVHQIRDNRGNDARVLLENVLVKAVDLLPVRPDDRPGMVGATATLEVTPQDGLKLTAAQGSGTIFLQLRPYNDTSKIESAEIDAKDIVPPPAPPEKKPDGTVVAVNEVKPDQEKKVYQTIISGGSVSHRSFWLDKQGNVTRSEVQDSPGPRSEPKADGKLDRLPSPDDKKAPSKDDASSF